jgi:hypothetical protein
MSKSQAQSKRIFSNLGKLVVRWNDVETQLRRLLLCVTDDWFNATLLTIDLPVANFIQALKTIVSERDVDAARFNTFIEAISQKTGRTVRPTDLVSEHVNHVLECADRLRMYRNLYAHCITSPTDDVPHFTLGGMTARNGHRLKRYDFPVDLRKIRKTIAAIERTVQYAQRVEKCIKIAQDSQRPSGPKWPKKPSLPPKLDKPMSTISDRIPLL